jgi:hypothetical protein
MSFLGTLLGSLLLILFGLSIAFYGYGIFRVILPVIGFILGLMIGRALLADSPFWGWVLGFGLAIVLAVISYAYWSVMIGLSGAILGFTLGTALAHMIGLWDWIALLAGLALAVAFGFLYFRFRDLFVMVSTGLTGAALVLYGIGFFIPWFAFLKDQGNWFTFLLTLALGVFGALVQVQIFRGMTYYSAVESRTPPPVLITRSNPT